MKLEQFFQQYLRTEDRVLDIGACDGDLSFLAAKLVGESGRVYSFEPHPDLFKKLEKATRNFSERNIEVYQLACSDAPGRVNFFYGTEPFARAASTIVPQLANQDRLGKEVQVIEVEATTVDQFCMTRDIVPQFVKIDVEGAEQNVLDGMRETIRKSLPLIIFESGCSTSTIPVSHQTLRNLGYQLFLVEFTKFLDLRPDWNNTMTSDVPKLGCHLIHFEAGDLSKLAPWHGNMAAFSPEWLSRETIPTKNLIEAISLLEPPRRSAYVSARHTLKRFLPKPIVSAIRKLKRVGK